MKQFFTKYAAAAVVLIAALTGIYRLTGSFDGAAVAWADVVERFSSMSFYNAVFYFKEDAAAEPRQVELWVSSEHKARVRVDSQVLFADKGKFVAGYNFKSKQVLKTVEYDEMAQAIIEKLCQQPQLSLDRIVSLISNGQLQEKTPDINSDAMISQDLLVFDVVSQDRPEWTRIWALRESRLPVRMRMWDPRDGGSMDVMVTYDKQQPENFFSPGQYEELLKLSERANSRGHANLAYAFLKDPGGRDYVPQDLFNRDGYHLPCVEQTGMTPYGAFWIMSSRAQNRSPNGSTFYGFSTVSDNLGRSYYASSSIWRLADDLSVQVFVPRDYPFDRRIPSSITLTCHVQTNTAAEPTEVIGTLEMTEWKQNTPWPSDKISLSDNDTILSAAYRFVRDKQYDQADAAARMISQSADGEKYAHQLSRLQLHKLISRRQFAQADALAEQLWPAELSSYKKPIDPPSPYVFTDYIVAIAANGRVDRAAQLWGELRKIEPDLSRWPAGAQKHFAKSIQDQFNRPGMVTDLFNICRLNLEQVNQIIGFDVLQNDYTKSSVPEEYRRQQDPDYIAATRHLEELTQYYQAHPLEPNELDLRKRDKWNRGGALTVRGPDDYQVYPVGGTLKNYIRHAKYPEMLGRVKFQAGLEDIQLQHDVVVHGEASPEKILNFLLAQFGWQVTEAQEACAVWVAQYDQRPLPDYKTIQALELGGTYRPGSLSSKSSAGKSLNELFCSLRRDQDIVIENQTGLDKNTTISEISLNFEGEQGAGLAETWFKDNFGITFGKEQRTLTVWVVQKSH